MTRKRKDITIIDSGKIEIQELLNVAQDKKEILDYRKRYYIRKSDQIQRQIKLVKDNFRSFLETNNIDPSYPVFNDALSDDAVPDTVAEQYYEAINFDRVILPTLSNYTIVTTTDVMEEKFVTLMPEIEEFVDTILKLKLNKAKADLKIEEINKVQDEYLDKINSQKEEYDQSVSNLEKIKYLYDNLLNFKSLFTVIPDQFTSKTYSDFQNNYLDKYSSYYCLKKKHIRNAADRLVDNYEPVPIPGQDQEYHLAVFNEILFYFSPESEQQDNEDSLPNQYVDALPKKKDIIAKIDSFSTDINVLIRSIKISLDNLRGVKGIGNSTIEGLISSTEDLLKSPATRSKMNQGDINTIIDSNNVIGRRVVEKVNEVKNKLQRGVDSLDEAFIRAQKNLLRRIATSIGFPINYEYNREKNLEDHLREKIRNEYGGDIPFCDEVRTTSPDGEIVFIKKSDMDETTGQTKIYVESEKLRKMTKSDRSILSD